MSEQGRLHCHPCSRDPRPGWDSARPAGRCVRPMPLAGRAQGRARQNQVVKLLQFRVSHRPASPSHSRLAVLQGTSRLSQAKNRASGGRSVPRMATRAARPARSGSTRDGATALSSAQSAVPVQSAIRQAATRTFGRSHEACRKNAAFLRLDSTSVTRDSGRSTATGSPGKPAPEPTSTSDAAGGSSLCRNAASPKCRRATSTAPVIRVRFMRRFQCSSSAWCAASRSIWLYDAAMPISSSVARSARSNLVTFPGACPESSGRPV